MLVACDLLFIPIIFHFPECHINVIIQYIYPFGSGFFYLAKCIYNSPVLCLSINPSFSSLNSVPLYGCTAVCLFVHPLKDIWLLAVFRDYEKLLKHLYVGFCVNINFKFTWAIPRSVITRSYCKSMSDFISNC